MKPESIGVEIRMLIGLHIRQQVDSLVRYSHGDRVRAQIPLSIVLPVEDVLDRIPTERP